MRVRLTKVRLAVAALLITELFCGRFGGAAPAIEPHPLDPLTADEFATIARVLTKSGRFSSKTKFAWVELSEPAKPLGNELRPASDVPRRAYVAAIDFAVGKSFAVTIDVREERMLAMVDLQGAQPGLTDRDIEIARAVVGSDPRIGQALRRHGITADPRSVRALYLGVGTDPARKNQSGRLVRVVFVTDQEAMNDFGPVLDGVMVVVDVFARQVVTLYDRRGAPLVEVPHDIFDPNLRAAVASGPAPAVSVAGRSVRIEGHQLEWANWRLRFGFNPREGLVLYQISYRDGDKARSILYRASVSEIVSRYGDPRDVWPFMEFFDESNFGLGQLATAVRPGREVPANAVTLSPRLATFDQASSSESYPDRIYAYERDGGLLTYYRQRSRLVEQRNTELVIGFIASLGNYQYGLNWVFKQDGSFGFEAELMGQILTKLTGEQHCAMCAPLIHGRSLHAASRSPSARFGARVAPNVIGVNHQHWFSLRLDFDVDGPGNAVMENDIRRVGQRAPGLTERHTVLRRARDAKRDVDEHAARTWTIYNPSALSHTGRPAGYTIVPLANASTIFPRSREKDPAGFTFHHLWVTPYRPHQLFADGRYPNQAKQNYRDTLFFYANGDAIYDRDIVVWYSLGQSHVPRPEDYPLMSSMKLSVLFLPEGFFDANPALGVTRESDD